MFFRSLVSSTPSTTMLPCWCSSSRLMQRIIVDLPEPDGPQMTMRSPLLHPQVDVLEHVELAVPLVHALQFDHGLAGGRGVRRRVGADAVFMCFSSQALSACGRCAACALEPLAVARHAETEHPEDAGRRTRSRSVEKPEPVGVGVGGLDAAEQVEQADDQHQARVLEQRDERVDDARDHELERLRQDDEADRSASSPARAPSAASYCPRGIACRPPRTTSAM